MGSIKKVSCNELRRRMKRIALLTSGGDAPGMNAAIRSVVRVASVEGREVLGVRRGFRGLLIPEITPLGPRDVSNIIQRGGTLLKTARSEEFKTQAGLEKAANVLDQNGVDGLIVIGGDGSLRGAAALDEIWSGSVIGVPGTIDNDLYGTDFTVGFDTAVNTALDAIDKIRDTAESHDRFFLVEVMGNRCGSLALHAGIGAGAEEIVIPEDPIDLHAICNRLLAGKDRGKTSTIVVVSEGERTGGAFRLAKDLKARADRDYRVTILGHLQRGGSPSGQDRILGTKLGAFAVELLVQGKSGLMAGEVKGCLVDVPFKDTWTIKKSVDSFLFGLQDKLSI